MTTTTSRMAAPTPMIRAGRRPVVNSLLRCSPARPVTGRKSKGSPQRRSCPPTAPCHHLGVSFVITARVMQTPAADRLQVIDEAVIAVDGAG